jgi:C-methyltransferase
MFEAALGGPYDLAIASHVFHNLSEARGGQLLRRLSAALGPGGRIAIQDFLGPDSRPADDPLPCLVSVLLLVSDGGRPRSGSARVGAPRSARTR